MKIKCRNSTPFGTRRYTIEINSWADVVHHWREFIWIPLFLGGCSVLLLICILFGEPR